MKLDSIEAKYFNTLYSGFLILANKKLKILENLEKPRDLLKTNPYKQLELRKLIYENMNEHIDSFLELGNLSDLEKKDVESWKEFITSTFLVYRHLKNHSIFIDMKNDAKIYGVLALIDDMEKVIPFDTLPLIVEGTLLPFRDKIIYDGMFGASDFYEPSMVTATKKYIEDSKTTGKIITSLPEENSVSKGSDWEGYDKVDKSTYFLNNSETIMRRSQKIGRNDSCHCGSGKKYKKCCGK